MIHVYCQPYTVSDDYQSWAEAGGPVLVAALDEVVLPATAAWRVVVSLARSDWAERRLQIPPQHELVVSEMSPPSEWIGRPPTRDTCRSQVRLRREPEAVFVEYWAEAASRTAVDPAAELDPVDRRRRLMSEFCRLLPGNVTSDPAVMGGKPCFRGTRFPVYSLFNDLADGYTSVGGVCHNYDLPHPLATAFMESLTDALRGAD